MSHYRRPRPLLPSAFESERVASLSDRGFRMWEFLKVNADDEGRSDYFLGQLQARPFLARPLTAQEAQETVDEIERLGLAIFYEKDGKRYYQITGAWYDGQGWDYTPNGKAFIPSTYPPPDGWKPPPERPRRKRSSRLRSDYVRTTDSLPASSSSSSSSSISSGKDSPKKLTGEDARTYRKAMDREREQKARVQEAAARDPAVPTSVKELLEQTTQKLGGKK